MEQHSSLKCTYCDGKACHTEVGVKLVQEETEEEPRIMVLKAVEATVGKSFRIFFASSTVLIALIVCHCDVPTCCVAARNLIKQRAVLAEPTLPYTRACSCGTFETSAQPLRSCSGCLSVKYCSMSVVFLLSSEQRLMF